MNRLTYILIIILIFGCQSESENNDHWGGLSPDLISAVDISDYPKILSYSPTFYDENNNEINFINALIQNGVNTIRLRLWVNPADESSSLEEVKEFSNELRSMGFKIWITPHFSDTWAHPGQQQIPSNWESLSFEELKNQLYAHTNQIMSEINPDYIQIGNEINTGILFPHGNIMDNQDQFIELVNAGVDAVRNNSTNTKIILHCAGFESSNWFFNIVKEVDYDIAGISYYPWWHGKSLDDLQNQLSNLSINFNKEILIARGFITHVHKIPCLPSSLSVKHLVNSSILLYSVFNIKIRTKKRLYFFRRLYFAINVNRSNSTFLKTKEASGKLKI